MDNETFATNYLQGLKSTTKFLVSRGLSEDFAAEFAQEAWMRAWERIGQLRDESRIIAWVNSIAFNAVRHDYRKSRRHIELDDKHQRLCFLDTAAIDMKQLMSRCDKDHRRWLQAQLEGFAPEELASAEGVTESGMRVRFFRARRVALKHIYNARRSGVPAKKAPAKTKFANNELRAA